MSNSANPSDLDIAIVGMAGRFPGAPTLADFWDNLRCGVESITRFSDAELRELGVSENVFGRREFVKAAPVLDDADLFDAEFFGFTATEALWLDPQHRVFLECCWEALESAGCDPSSYDGLIGVFGGASLSSYLLYNLLPWLDGPHAEDAFSAMIANDKDFLSTRVAYKLNLSGPSLTVQTGCSTSLVAIHLAAQSLLSYQCDLALAGGVSIQTRQRTGHLWQEGGLMSPDGHCRAFDASAGGTLFGSGCGVIVLKRLSDALAQGDAIRAIVKGSAINNDGARKLGFTAPSVEGQAQVIAAALAVADVPPELISYVECHGTGTPLGDPVEILALTRALGGDRRAKCRIGSVKTNIGHLDAAAGVAGVIKTVLALENELIPPSLHFEQPNPRLEIHQTAFEVAGEPVNWPRSATPRYAGVSSFGIGGTNAHIVLAEAAETAQANCPDRPRLILISARTESALESATVRMGSFLAASNSPLDDIAWTTHTGRRAFSWRRALVAADNRSAAEILGGTGPGQFYTGCCGLTAPPVAFLFPGGGTQHPGMGSDLYREYRMFRENVDRCALLVQPLLGRDIRELMYPESNRVEEAREELRDPSIGLPALLITEYALAQLWMSLGVRPGALIGHSLGEYTAACIAGVFTLEDVLRLVVERSRLLSRIQHGAMLSVAASAGQTAAMLTGTLSIAAVNGPALCTVAGTEAEIESLTTQLDAAQFDWRRVPIETASHSSMIEPVLGSFRALVSRFQLSLPRIPFVSNVTGEWARAEEVTEPEYWVSHLRRTVEFAKGLELLLEDRQRVLLEVGPGRALTSFAKTVIPDSAQRAIVASMRHSRERIDDCSAFLTAAGRLWTVGAPIKTRQLWNGESRRKVCLPSYPFERRSYWLEPPAGSVANAASAGRIRDVSNWFYRPAWTASPLPVSATDTAERRWLMLTERGSFGALLNAGLGDGVVNVYAGSTLRRVGENEWELPPDNPAAYRQLLQILAEENFAPTDAVHLWSRSASLAGAGRERLVAVGAQGLTWLGQALGAIGSEVRVAVVSAHAFAVESTDRVEPAEAALLGPCRVLPQEFERLRSRLIDASGDGMCEEALAEVIAAELKSSSRDAVVAYRGKRRWRLDVEPYAIPAEARRVRRFRRGGAYAITGGCGTVGLHLAGWLARHYEARIVLIGRTRSPNREDWAGWLREHEDSDPVSRRIRGIQQIQQQGGEVMSLATDVGDVQSLRGAVAQAQERFGAIHGFIHAAGVTGAQAVSLAGDLTPDEFEQVMHAKIAGAEAIGQVCQELRPDFVLLMSSMASVIGGPGLLAYTAANAYLDAVAEARCDDPNTCWLSANWDSWPAAETRESRGPDLAAASMSAEESVDAFARLIECAAPGQTIVSTCELRGRIRTWIDEAGRSRHTRRAAHSRPAVAAQFHAASNETERIISEAWKEVLGLDQVGIHDNFFDLGGNSLTGMRMINRLRQLFGIDLKILALFEGPTVAALAATIAAKAAEGGSEASYASAAAHATTEHGR